MKITKELILEFLIERGFNQIIDIKSFKTDINIDNYIVKCILKVPDTNIPINNNLGRKEKECLIDVNEFNMWLNKKNAVKWI